MKMFRSMILLLSLMVCQVQAQQALTEEDAMATLNGFFRAFSVENYPNPGISDWITDDFLIFEMGHSFTWASFQSFLESAGYADWISTDWQFSDLRVSLAGQAAHISYVNEGNFIYPDADNPGKRLQERNRWLESVYHVEDDGRLNIKSLQSDNVTREISSYP